MKVTAAVTGFGLMLSSISSTGKTIRAAEPEPILECSESHIIQTHAAAARLKHINENGNAMLFETFTSGDLK